MSEINETNQKTVDDVRRLSDKINDATKELEALLKPTWFLSRRSLNTTIKIKDLQNKIKALEKERLRKIREVKPKTRRIMAGVPIENKKPPIIPINHEAAATRAAEIEASVATFQNIIKQAAAREATAKETAKAFPNPGSKKGGRRLTRSKRRAASTRRKRV